MYAAAAVLFAGACLQGLSGFGYSLFSLPLLVLLMPASSAVPVLSVTSIFLNLLVLIRTRRHLDLRWMAPLLVSGAAGILPGVWVLRMADPGTMRVAIGAIVVMASAAMLLGIRLRLARERLAMVAAGLLSGALNGATTFSGPPVILLLANQRVPRHRFRGSLAAYFLALNILAVPAFAVGGLLTASVGLDVARSFPAVAAGAMLGIWLAGRVGERLFGVLALLAMALLGVMSIASAL